jgi:hypothetical protein
VDDLGGSADPTGRPDGDEQRRLDRRDAIKKAMAGAATAGAVWAAPGVRNLSLAPDYAMAGTGTASVTVVFDGADGSGTFDGAGGQGSGCTGAGGDDYAFFNPPSNPTFTRTSGNQHAQPGAVNASAPLGAAGNVNASARSGFLFDRRNVETLNIVFSIDPPFNRCRVSAANLRNCSNNNEAAPLTGNPAPGATNPSAPFTVGVNVPSTPSSGNTLASISVTIECTA